MSYSYKHHIIPKHEWLVRFGDLKGFNSQDNIVRLTLLQHAEAHKWLWEEYNSEKDRLAWMMLSGQMGKEELQRELARMTGKKNKGRKHTTQQNLEKSIRQLGDRNPFFSHHHTQEFRELKGIMFKTNPACIEVRRKLKILQTGVPLGPHPIICCPHCQKVGGSHGMKRYHFDNCKARSFQCQTVV